MKSQYLELQAIAHRMQAIANEAFKFEKAEAIIWIKKQMVLFDLTPEQILQKKIKVCVKNRLNESKDFHGSSFLKRTDDACMKLSVALKGRKKTQEHRKNLSLSHLNRRTPSIMGQPVRINNVNYRSFSDAGRALGLAPGVVRSRCNNMHLQFKDWVSLDAKFVYLKVA